MRSTQSPEAVLLTQGRRRQGRIVESGEGMGTDHEKVSEGLSSCREEGGNQTSGGTATNALSPECQWFG